MTVGMMISITPLSLGEMRRRDATQPTVCEQKQAQTYIWYVGNICQVNHASSVWVKQRIRALNTTGLDVNSVTYNIFYNVFSSVGCYIVRYKMTQHIL